MKPRFNMQRSVMLLAFLACLNTSLALAQPGNKVVPFLSTLPTNTTENANDARVETVALRPNAEFTYFVHVQNNDSQDLDALKVLLTSDPEGKQILAEGTVTEITQGDTVGVAMTAIAPAVPIPTPTIDPLTKPTEAPRGTELGDSLYLWIIDTKVTLADIAKGTDPFLYRPAKSIEVRLNQPANYITSEIRYTNGTLQIILSDNDEKAKDVEVLKTGPAKVSMEIFNAPVGNGPIDSIMTPALQQGATLQTFVRDGSTNTQLIVNNLKTANRPLLVALTVDGYTGAFVYKTDLNGTSPTSLDKPALRVAAPRYAIPGKPLDAELQIFGDMSTGTPVLEFQRTEAGDPEIVTSGRTTPRDQRNAYEVAKDGGITFIQTTKNWVVPIDTTGVYGKRELRFKLTDTAGETAPTPSISPLILDDTPPVLQKLNMILPLGTLYGKELEERSKAQKLKPSLPIVTEINLEAEIVYDLLKAEREKDIRVIARIADPESGVNLDSVYFYLGSPPDEKGVIAKGSFVSKPNPYILPTIDEKSKEVVFGKEPVPGTYYAKFRLPKTVGPIEAGVVFANNVGQVVTRTFNVEVIDPPEPPKPPTTGTIEVFVVQGNDPARPQPGLTVVLYDAAQLPIKTATTSAKGEATFKDLEPGNYFITSIKPADANASGSGSATVVAGETAKVGLNLKR